MGNGVLGFWNRAFGPDSIESQRAATIREAAEEGLGLIYQGSGDLHGTGSRSHVLVFRDRELARSDEIRILDRDGSELRERFAFRPRGSGLGADRAIYLVGLSGADRPITDLDRDGRSELVLAFGSMRPEKDFEPGLLRPVLVHWDPLLDDAGGYRIDALIPNGRTLEGELTGRSTLGPPVVLRDNRGEARFDAPAVEEFVVIGLASGAYAATVGGQRPRGVGADHAWVRVWRVDWFDGTTNAAQCLLMRPMVRDGEGLRGRLRKAAREATACL